MAQKHWKRTGLLHDSTGFFRTPVKHQIYLLKVFWRRKKTKPSLSETVLKISALTIGDPKSERIILLQRTDTATHWEAREYTQLYILEATVHTWYTLVHCIRKRRSPNYYFHCAPLLWQGPLAVNDCNYYCSRIAVMLLYRQQHHPTDQGQIQLEIHVCNSIDALCVKIFKTFFIWLLLRCVTPGLRSASGVP